MGRASGPTKVDNVSQARVRGFSVLSQDSVQEEAGKALDKSNQSNLNPSDADAPKEVTTRAVAAPNQLNDLVESREETTRVVALHSSKSNLEIRKDCVMEDRIENPHAVCQQDTNQVSGFKRKAVAKNKGKGSEGLGIRNSKGKNSKSHKRLSHITERKSELSSSTEGLGSDSLVGNGKDIARINSSTTVRMGHLVQEPYGGHSRCYNSSDSSGANGDSELVRDRVGAGLEASVSHHAGEHQNGSSTIGAQCLVPYTQSVVEVSNGCAGGLGGNVGEVEQAKEAISHASLGRIRVDHSREEARGFQRNGHGTHGEPSNAENVSNYGSGEDLRRTAELQRGYNWHPEAHDHLEAELESIQGSSEEDGMEYGGSSCNEY